MLLFESLIRPLNKSKISKKKERNSLKKFAILNNSHSTLFPYFGLIAKISRLEIKQKNIPLFKKPLFVLENRFILNKKKKML
jgi:hypothetical protein